MDLSPPRNRSYLAILAAVASVILLGGWWARPREVAETPDPVPTDTELEQLTRRAQRRSLDDMKQFFAAVAHDAAGSIVAVKDEGTSGVAWDPARIVTTARHRASTGPVNLVAATETQAEPATWGPNLPLAVLNIRNAAAAPPPVRRSTVAPAAGDWIVAVWRVGNAPAYGIGNVRQMSHDTCGDAPVEALASSLALTNATAGGGVFDLDGGLLAVILPCRDRLIAVTPASIDAILADAARPEQQLETRFGLSAAPLSADARAYFKTDAGLLVRSVWIDDAADRAGVRPGDIITAAGGTPVTDVSALADALAGSDATRDITVLRGRSRLTIPLADAATAATTSEAATGAGLTLAQPAADPFAIASVRPGSRAADAGLQPGDRLVRIDQATPRSAADVERAINADPPRPTWLEVIRDGRRLGVLLR